MMIEKKPNIVFMGTPEFAVPSLDALNKEFAVCCVVSVPDKPQGRGMKLIPSPVKMKALELGLPVLQPESLKDENFISELKKFEPDIIVVIAFRILPPSVFNLAKIGAFNIHASLLPKYRGAAPINRAIINGDKTTGLTSFLLEDKVDTGKIILQNSIDIPLEATAGDLHDLLMPEAAIIAVETCRLLFKGNFKSIPQDNSLATPAPKLFREQCRINWDEPADILGNFIHGVSPVPGAWFDWNKKRYKVLRVKIFSGEAGKPGTFNIEKDKLYVQCGKGMITILEIQPQDKKAMKIEEFLRGYRGELRGELI